MEEMMKSAGNLDLWLAPLILLPGIGLLIMSTSVRFGNVQTHLAQLKSDGANHTRTLATSLHRRAHLFRYALSGLYLSTVMFTLSGTLNGLGGLLPISVFNLIVVMSFIGFIALMMAAVYLVRETLMATDVVNTFYSQMQENYREKL